MPKTEKIEWTIGKYSFTLGNISKGTSIRCVVELVSTSDTENDAEGKHIIKGSIDQVSNKLINMGLSADIIPKVVFNATELKRAVLTSNYKQQVYEKSLIAIATERQEELRKANEKAKAAAEKENAVNSENEVLDDFDDEELDSFGPDDMPDPISEENNTILNDYQPSVKNPL